MNADATPAITVYSKPVCVQCNATKRALDKKGLAYREVDVTTTPAALEYITGAAVASFTVASTPRTFDRQANDWKDGETLFLRGQVWRESAENVAESLSKGMRVIVTGRLVSRTFETKEGEKRTVIELACDEIGPSLRFASARVSRGQRSNAQPGPAQDRPAGQQPDPWASQPAGQA